MVNVAPKSEHTYNYLRVMKNMLHFGFAEKEEGESENFYAT